MISFQRGAHGVGDPEKTDLERRAADVVKFGTVKEVDYTRARVRVTIGDPDDDEGHLLTGWLPMAGGRAKGDSDWHPLEIGEHVMVLSESGEVQNGMVLPAARYSDDNPAPGAKAGLWRKKFQDGASIEYDRDSGEFLIDAKAKSTIKADGATIVSAPDQIKLTIGGATITMTDGQIVLSAGGSSFTIGGGGATSTGPIRGQDGLEVTGGVFTHDGKNVGKDHTHTGVQPGSGLSSIPA